jgi:hypothetical protein
MPSCLELTNFRLIAAAHDRREKAVGVFMDQDHAPYLKFLPVEQADCEINRIKQEIAQWTGPLHFRAR